MGPAMHFPALLTFGRRLAHRLTYEWYQLALWLAFGLCFSTNVRSAFRSGCSPAAAGPAVRPRRVSRAGLVPVISAFS